jgi:hypothetical protein
MIRKSPLLYIEVILIGDSNKFGELAEWSIAAVLKTVGL